MSSSRMNIFQRLIHQWEMLHPYNAGQIMKLAGRPDLAAINAAWEAAVRGAGLGWVRIRGRSYEYAPLNGSAGQCMVRELPAGAELEAFVGEEMNRPFDDEHEPPFRPFVLPCDGHYYLGLIYHHWIADSVSIRLLLREWFVRLFDPARAGQGAIRLAGSYWRDMGPGRAHWDLGEGLLTALCLSARAKRIRRLKDKGLNDLRAAFLIREAPEGWIDQLHALARARRAKLNDVFLAAMAQACYHVPAHYHKRQDLALGTIVDLRPFSQTDLTDTFGMFLGFTTVICRPVDLADPNRLLRSIAAQNATQKKSGTAQASWLRMAAAIVARLRPDRAVRFYQKRVPLAGGISNINLNHSWAADYHPNPLLDYLRISPTGPMSPLVFSTTTLGRRFHFGLTYRPALVPPERAAEIADQFMEELRRGIDGISRAGGPA